MTDTTTLSSEILDKLWVRFLVYKGINENYSPKTYKWISRRTHISHEFENWLFDQGATVKQSGRNRYLQFTDESQATMFALKYS